MFNVAGKVAVVTGASSGIGDAIAREFAAAGCHVVAVARREARLAQLATASDLITPYVADVTAIDQVDALAAFVSSQFGACHILVNNAGVPGGAFVGRGDLDDALDTLDVNLFGAIRCMAAFSELLAASAPSRVINVASVAGKLGVGPAAYAASKFALVGLSEATRFSWAPRGISVAELNPGFIETEGFPQLQIKRTPAARLIGKPGDVARAALQVARTGQAERTVPRWYRAFVMIRHTVAPLYRAVAERLSRAGGSRDL
ncbi:MAG: SDR family NAD(P)-dependent oxidoreductase [Nitriliruptoraceae bacterium]